MNLTTNRLIGKNCIFSLSVLYLFDFELVISIINDSFAVSVFTIYLRDMHLVKEKVILLLSLRMSVSGIYGKPFNGFCANMAYQLLFLIFASLGLDIFCMRFQSFILCLCLSSGRSERA